MQTTAQLNSIPQYQNEECSLKRLAAQRKLYSRAKVIFTAQVILTVAMAIVSSALALIFPEFKVWASIIGLSTSLLDAVWLEPRQKTLKQQAAKIQERFDCKVLALPWQSIKLGSYPDIETVDENAELYQRIDPGYSKLRNWYPTSVGELPLHVARIICQRANCWWDAALRRRYAAGIVVFLAALPFLLLVFGLSRGMTLESFVLAIFAPLSPAFLWGIREYRKQRDAADTLDKLRNQAEGLWAKAVDRALSPEQLTQGSRDLQNEIYDHRRSAPLIFDWIYERLRKSSEGRMNKAADELVKEFKNDQDG
jgi:hypothetical protein